jgi:hypothetical protein
MRIVVETKNKARVTSWHVRKILCWFRDVDLDGLETVQILDSEPNDPEAITQPPYLVGFLYCGRYQKSKQGATISLYTRDLYFAIPRVLQDRQLMLKKTPSALSDAERLWVYHRHSVAPSTQGGKLSAHERH